VGEGRQRELGAVGCSDKNRVGSEEPIDDGRRTPRWLVEEQAAGSRRQSTGAQLRLDSKRLPRQGANAISVVDAALKLGCFEQGRPVTTVDDGIVRVVVEPVQAGSH
jgi:hypothetical protein